VSKVYRAGLEDGDGSWRGGRPILPFLIGDAFRIRHVYDRERAGRGSSGRIGPGCEAWPLSDLGTPSRVGGGAVGDEADGEVLLMNSACK
jgi:hypothetical protein